MTVNWGQSSIHYCCHGCGYRIQWCISPKQSPEWELAAHQAPCPQCGHTNSSEMADWDVKFAEQTGRTVESLLSTQ